MTKIKSVASIEGNVIISLTEEEARALDAIVGYGLPNDQKDKRSVARDDD